MPEGYRAPSLRKLVGTFAMLLLVVVYVLGALLLVALTEDRIATLPSWLQMIIYAICGLAWVFPAMAIIKWMEKPRRS
jgi:uncharacterized membrane protein YuzA (DUF378 family)